MAGSAPNPHARRLWSVLATLSFTAAMLVVLVPAVGRDDVSSGGPTVGVHSSDPQAMIEASSPTNTLRVSGTCVGTHRSRMILNYSGCVSIRRSTGTQVDRC